MCFVTKKLVRFTKYAKAELKSRYQMILMSSLARARVRPTTFSSINSVAGSRSRTAIGAMYRRRFIGFSFSLEQNNKIFSVHFHTWIYFKWTKKTYEIVPSIHTEWVHRINDYYPSEESKIPWSTVLRALAAVAPIHMINPNRWKLGSPYSQDKEKIKE